MKLDEIIAFPFLATWEWSLNYTFHLLERNCNYEAFTISWN